MIDLFYPAVPSDDKRRADNPQIVINVPGGDAICFVHLAPDQPIVSFESRVEKVDTPDGGYYAYPYI
jgi:hypothetical protein